MRHARVPQDLEQVGRGVGLDRIERLARKLLGKEAGGARGGVRTKQRDRLDRALQCYRGNIAAAVRGFR